MKQSRLVLSICIMLFLAIVISGCAAGNERYAAKLAGFWAGLWHGLICIFTFIIGLFTDSVRMYETNNTGNWYDFGFILGAIITLGSGCGSHKRARRLKKKDDWDEIGEKVEEKIRTGIQNWLNEPKKKDEEWEEIGKKIEEKIKRELKNWADK